MIGGKTDIPVESIRLKLIREGLEDYEYMALAGRNGLAEDTDKAVNLTALSLYQWDSSPAGIYKARRALGGKLDERFRAQPSDRNTDGRAKGKE